MKVRVELDEQTAADLHALIQGCRDLETTKQTDELDARLRDAEFALAGGLRSVGWVPKPGGGWVQQHAPRRGGRF